jgi:hypothetical protein
MDFLFIGAVAAMTIAIIGLILACEKLGART